MRDANEIVGLGVLAVCANILLMLVKIGAGIAGNSYALVADGIESAGDILSSLITWAGYQLSLRPADDNHPYGHGKLESLAGVFSGGALLAAAGFIAWHAVLEIRTPHHAPSWFTLPVLLGVVAVKAWLSRRILAAGTELGSTALQGDAWHHRSDAISSAAAAIGIGVALAGGPGYEAADDWAALLACVVIVANGVLLLRTALHEVMDGSLPSPVLADIERIAAATEGVVDTEKCRVRKSGIALFVDIHVRVDPELSVREGHRISHAVKDRLLAGHPAIRDVTIHIEPAGGVS